MARHFLIVILVLVDSLRRDRGTSRRLTKDLQQLDFTVADPRGSPEYAERWQKAIGSNVTVEPQRWRRTG